MIPFTQTCGFLFVLSLILSQGLNAREIIPKRKVIAQFDIGFDDYVALNVLIEAKIQNEIEIVGLICAVGNSDLDVSCRNLIRALEIIDQTDIPIYKGLPTTGNRMPDNFFGKDGMNDLHFGTGVSLDTLQDIPASTALINLLKQHPKEISVLWAGPLTDFAAALEEDELAIINNIKDLWILGGEQRDKAEFNFRNDPEAAEITLNTGDYKKFLLTFDVSEKFDKKVDLESTRNSTNPTLRYINTQIDILEKKKGGYGFSDVCLVSTFLDYSITEEKLCMVHVETENLDNLGYCTFDCDTKSSVSVIEDMDGPMFERRYKRLEHL